MCPSAYCVGLSTETVILRVRNDAMCSLDLRRDVILIMLDMSAGFVTIEHDILMQR